MLQKTTLALLAIVAALAMSGCPSGSDREFDRFGIYYGVAPEGYIAAQYQVRASDRGKIDQKEAFRAAASEVEAVLEERVPLKNGTREDLRNVRTVTIMVMYVDDTKPAKVRDEVFGVASMRVTELKSVAADGPTREMQITDPAAWKERIEVIAAREHQRLLLQNPTSQPKHGESQRAKIEETR